MEFFEVQDIGSIRKITINNVKKKNAINRYAYIALAKLLDDAGTNDKVKCVVITGKGDFYSSGNDLSQSFMDMDAEGRNAPKVLVTSFINCPKLVVALVNGPAIGIAATTAALSDIVYCTESAYFWTPFTALGLCPEACSSYTFPRILGPSKANEVLILNQRLTAKEAYHFGLVSYIYKDEKEIWDKLKIIDDLPLGSIIASKKLIRMANKDKLRATNDAEFAELDVRMGTEEAIMAVVNFQNLKKSKL